MPSFSISATDLMGCRDELLETHEALTNRFKEIRMWLMNEAPTRSVEMICQICGIENIGINVEELQATSKQFRDTQNSQRYQHEAVISLTNELLSLQNDLNTICALCDKARIAQNEEITIDIDCNSLPMLERIACSLRVSKKAVLHNYFRAQSEHMDRRVSFQLVMDWANHAASTSELAPILQTCGVDLLELKLNSLLSTADRKDSGVNISSLTENAKAYRNSHSNLVFWEGMNRSAQHWPEEHSVSLSSMLS